MSRFDKLRTRNSEKTKERNNEASSTRKNEESGERTIEGPNDRRDDTSTSRPVDDAASRRVGRPPGKRSNPDYTQVTGYIRKATYSRVKHRLIDEERDFGELIEDLLMEWLES